MKQIRKPIFLEREEVKKAIRKNVLIIFFIFTLFFIYSMTKWLSVPVMYWSCSQNECVKIVISGIEYPCDMLPEKYERLWVK